MEPADPRKEAEKLVLSDQAALKVGADIGFDFVAMR